MSLSHGTLPARIGFFRSFLALTTLYGILTGAMPALAAPPLLTAPAIPSDGNAPKAEALLQMGKQALEAGNPKEALLHLRQAASQAARVKDVKSAGLANETISQLVNAMPAWVDEALEKAGSIPKEKAGAAKAWAKSREAAQAQADKGDLPQALRMARQALDLARENLGPKHSATFMSERELGTLLTLAGKPAEAEPLLRQAATHAREALGAEHPESLACDKAVADLLESQGKPADALKIHQAARTAWQARLGLDHPLAIDADLAMAGVLRELGRHDEADLLLRESCPRSMALHGYHHPETARCLEGFARLNLAREAFADGREALEQALGILEGVMAGDDPTLPPLRIAAAETNRRLGDLKRADELLKPALPKEPFQVNDPLAMEALAARLHLLADQGELPAAETLARKLLKQLAAALGNDHPTTLTMNVELAAILEKQGRYPEAEIGLKKTLELMTKSLGEDHPTTLTTLNNLGQLLEEAGLYDDAEPLLRQALEKSQARFGPDRPLTLTTMNNLALLHESQGNFDKAEPLYLNALDAYRKRLGERHVDTQAVVNNPGYLHLLKRDYAKAKP
ncbi:MAG: tetratricopeptide repeat protein, partial [Magnetococcales bacterium]|nr:tetratricopeptide repeat protein [Magnetococcales bacterium]